MPAVIILIKKLIFILLKMTDPRILFPKINKEAMEKKGTKLKMVAPKKVHIDDYIMQKTLGMGK